MQKPLGKLALIAGSEPSIICVFARKGFVHAADYDSLLSRLHRRNLRSWALTG